MENQNPYIQTRSLREFFQNLEKSQKYDPCSVALALARALGAYHTQYGPHGFLGVEVFTLNFLGTELSGVSAKLEASGRGEKEAISSFGDDIRQLASLFRRGSLLPAESILAFMDVSTTGKGYRSVPALIFDIEQWQRSGSVLPGSWNPYCSVDQFPLYWVAEMERILGRYRDGKRSSYIVAEAGSGKTSLLRALHHELAQESNHIRYYVASRNPTGVAEFWNKAALDSWFPGAPEVPEDLTTQEQVTTFLLQVQSYLEKARGSGQSFVFILDDLQWLDRVGCQILEIIQQTDSSPCQIIGGSRSPASFMGDDTIQLPAISPQRLWLYLSRCFEGMAELQRLFALLQAIVYGSMFHLMSVLKKLYDQKVLAFDHVTGVWEFSLYLMSTDTVPAQDREFLINELKRESVDQDKIVFLTLAILARPVSLQEISTLFQLPRQTASQRISYWMRKNWLRAFLEDDQVRQYEFCHDNYRQAVLAFYSTQSHLSFRKTILSQLSSKPETLNPIEIVYLLSYPGMVDWYLESRGTAQDILAGLKAMENKGLHTQGFMYACRCLDQFTEYLWKRDAACSFSILKLALRLGLLATEYVQAMELGRKFIPYLTDRQERFTVDSTTISAHFAQHHLQDCVREFQNAGQLLGLPKQKRYTALWPSKYLELKIQWLVWKNRNLNLPELPGQLQLRQELVCRHFQEYYLGSAETFPGYVLEVFHDTLLNRPGKFTSTVLILTAMVCLGWLRDPSWGLELGNFALSLEGILPGEYPPSALKVIHGLMIDHWQNPWHQTARNLKTCFFQNKTIGDYPSAGLALNIALSNTVFSQGVFLPQIYKEFIDLEAELKVLGQARSHLAYRRHLQIVSQLIQASPERLSSVAQGPHFDWVQELPLLRQHGDETALFDLHLNRMAIALLLGRPEEAAELVELVESFAERYRSQTKEGLFHYLASLLACVASPNSRHSRRYSVSLKLRARYNPEEYHYRFRAYQLLRRGRKGLPGLRKLIDQVFESRFYFDTIVLVQMYRLLAKVGPSQKPPIPQEDLKNLIDLGRKAAEAWGAQSLVTKFQQELADYPRADQGAAWVKSSGDELENGERLGPGLSPGEAKQPASETMTIFPGSQDQASGTQLQHLAAIGTIASALIHEIRNPNHIIQLNAQILQTRAGNSEDEIAWESARDILDSCKKITGIVDQVKTLSRPQGERFSGNLIQVCQQVIKNAVSSHGLAHETLSSNVSGTGLFIGDELRVYQAVYNIVENALNAIPASGGWVTLRVFQDAQYTMCEVSDNGTGISPESLTEVRKPFYTTRADRGGTGLGLFITETVVKEMAGTLDIHSTLGIGTVVKIALPRFIETTQDLKDRSTFIKGV